MIFTNEKAVSLIVKLNKLTSTDQIKWHFEDPPREILRGTDNVIPIFMVTSYKNQKFALYIERFQTYDGDRDRFFWNERITLSMIDLFGRVIWETSEYYSALLDLYETARSKTANIDGIFNDILGDD